MFFVAFCFVEKHLHTKFQKISLNGLDFANFLHFWSILAVFLVKNGQKRPKSKKRFFAAFFVLLGSIYSPISENVIKRFESANFLHFWSNLAVFWLKKCQKKAEIQKKVFLQHFFCWEASTNQISENFIKPFRFCQFSSFLVNFGCFLV